MPSDISLENFKYEGFAGNHSFSFSNVEVPKKLKKDADLQLTYEYIIGMVDKYFVKEYKVKFGETFHQVPFGGYSNV